MQMGLSDCECLLTSLSSSCSREQLSASKQQLYSYITSLTSLEELRQSIEYLIQCSVINDQLLQFLLPGLMEEICMDSVLVQAAMENVIDEYWGRKEPNGLIKSIRTRKEGTGRTQLSDPSKLEQIMDELCAFYYFLSPNHTFVPNLLAAARRSPSLCTQLLMSLSTFMRQQSQFKLTWSQATKRVQCRQVASAQRYRIDNECIIYTHPYSTELLALTMNILHINPNCQLLKYSLGVVNQSLHIFPQLHRRLLSVENSQCYLLCVIANRVLPSIRETANNEIVTQVMGSICHLIAQNSHDESLDARSLMPVLKEVTNLLGSIIARHSNLSAEVDSIIDSYRCDNPMLVFFVRLAEFLAVSYGFLHRPTVTATAKHHPQDREDIEAIVSKIKQLCVQLLSLELQPCLRQVLAIVDLQANQTVQSHTAFWFTLLKQCLFNCLDYESPNNQHQQALVHKVMDWLQHGNNYLSQDLVGFGRMLLGSASKKSLWDYTGCKGNAPEDRTYLYYSDFESPLDFALTCLSKGIEYQFEYDFNPRMFESSCNLFCYLKPVLHASTSLTQQKKKQTVINVIKTLINLSESCETSCKRVIIRKVIMITVHYADTVISPDNYYLQEVVLERAIDNLPASLQQIKLIQGLILDGKWLQHIGQADTINGQPDATQAGKQADAPQMDQQGKVPQIDIQDNVAQKQIEGDTVQMNRQDNASQISGQVIHKLLNRLDDRYFWGQIDAQKAEQILEIWEIILELSRQSGTPARWDYQDQWIVFRSYVGWLKFGWQIDLVALSKFKDQNHMWDKLELALYEQMTKGSAEGSKMSE